MLDPTMAGVARRQRTSIDAQRQAPKWRQLGNIVGNLAAQLDPGAQFQIIAYSDDARSVVAGADGRWLDVGEPRGAQQAMRTLRTELTPSGPSNLHAALTAAATLEPPADTIYLVTDRLPTAGPLDIDPTNDDARRRLFERTLEAVPPDVPLNVILLPLEGDSLAAPAYWALALRSGGSLLAPPPDDVESAILGMPLDSEYLAFVIDTSGSMRMYAWDDLVEHIVATLEAYPSVEGIQVLNDEGEFMLQASTNDWIPNTPAQRAAVLDALADWTAFSNSNPRNGVVTAIETLSAEDRKVAIYVYGDDFARDAVNDFLLEVSSRNVLDDDGIRRARIHSVAFPVYYEVTGSLLSAADYAALMRDLSQRNGGGFIALPAH